MNAVVASILSLAMTWTVESKSVVSGSGTFPSVDMDAGYSCTYQKGDVRQGDTATLVLNGMGGIDIERVEVYVKSNKSSGAGTFVVEADGRRVATKSGTFQEWTGAYDNSAYHAVALVESPIYGVNELVIQLAGSANSLHIEKYIIHYAQALPHTVTLMTGNGVLQTVAEQQGGAGITLPVAPEIPDWEFAGWSETEFWDADVLPVPLFYPAEKYYPREDGTLWAVYVMDMSPSIPYETELCSGMYIYMNHSTQEALQGIPENGQMTASQVNLYDEQQYYRIEFDETASTATITHDMTGTPIGYSDDARMIAAPSVWNVYHDGEQTLFYTTIGSASYVLWLDILGNHGNEYYYYAGLLQASPGKSSMRLLSSSMPERRMVYTCHPEAQGIDEVKSEGMSELTNEWTIPFGNYQIVIRNGQKELRLW